MLDFLNSPDINPRLHHPQNGVPGLRSGLCENGESLLVSVPLMILSGTSERKDEEGEMTGVLKKKGRVVIVGLDVDGEEKKMDVDI